MIQGKKRKFCIRSDSDMLQRLNTQLNKDTKTFIKVKRIVHASTKTEATPHLKDNMTTKSKESSIVSKTNKQPELNSINSISFEELHKNVRAVKLPTKNWKIKMFMTEKKKPLKIVFTNKEENERCVSFSYCSHDFVITFSGYTVNLIGAPRIVESVDDISILLSIVNKISVIDPILEYI